MDPTREPRSTAAEPTSPSGTLSDDAVVAHLRARAPGLQTSRFDARTVTSRARGALRRRRLRNSMMALAGAAAAYLMLALAGPLPVPGAGTVSVPGSSAIQALAGRFLPVGPPGPSQRQADVDSLETEVLPVVEDLKVSLYLLESGPCRILEYPRGNYRDGDPECADLVPFDAAARADFDEVTDAVERSGVAVERIFRVGDAVGFQLPDNSWQYNWEYVHLPGVDSPPPLTGRPIEERWTHIHGDWWLHRVFDD
ncbi:hypothetical protein GA0070609_5772 [Micromonospora echinaurantiaca]|uniref:Uncharacterized protein n=1 Tax=Micromonospora echinaurantiaca TaxID=47857 RepID=A0A1C5K8M4_9ACTN|nr:hypothetical protein [Micromonospora echinaurantiaca]SCG79064.1 hypothetical protein GA0070609_5772 [Micromonospora echinaurantiaca]